MQNQNQNQDNRTDEQRLSEARQAYEEIDFSIKLAIVMCKGVQLIQQEHELDPELEGLIDGLSIRQSHS